MSQWIQQFKFSNSFQIVSQLNSLIRYINLLVNSIMLIRCIVVIARNAYYVQLVSIQLGNSILHYLIKLLNLGIFWNCTSGNLPASSKKQKTQVGQNRNFIFISNAPFCGAGSRQPNFPSLRVQSLFPFSQFKQLASSSFLLLGTIYFYLFFKHFFLVFGVLCISCVCQKGWRLWVN